MRFFAVGVGLLPYHALRRLTTKKKRRHLRAMVALEHPLTAQLRVESAIVMQSLVRRFLARTLVCQASKQIASCAWSIIPGFICLFDP